MQGNWLLKIHKIPTMWLTVGLPGVGKTTWAHNTGMPVVDADDYRYVDGHYSKTEEREPWVWIQHNNKLRTFLGLGTSFVVADTFLTRKFRLQYATAALKAGYRVCVMWLRAPQSVYVKDGIHAVPEAVYVKMREEFQVPCTLTEPFAKVYTRWRGE